MANINAILDIPELFAEICRLLLTSVELVPCVLVSRKWNDLFTPHLWANISISARRELTIFSDKVVQNALRRNRHVVRSFNAYSADAVNIFSRAYAEDRSAAASGQPPSEEQGRTETHLLSLQFHWSGTEPGSKGKHYSYDEDESEEDEEEWDEISWQDAMSCLIGKSPHLQDLYCEFGGFYDSDFPWCFQSHPNLRHLNIVAAFPKATMDPDILWSFVEALPDGLESVTFDFGMFSQRLCEDFEPYPSEYRKQSLKSITLRGDVLAALLPIQNRILKGCPTLEHFTLCKSLRQVDIPLFAQLLQESCPRLTALTLTQADRSINDSTLARLLSIPPTATDPASTSSKTARWRYVNIDARNFGPMSGTALLRHAATLETVHLIHAGLQAQHKQSLLALAPGLKTLTSY